MKVAQGMEKYFEIIRKIEQSDGRSCVFSCLRHELPGFLHRHADPLDVGVLLLVDPLQHLVLGIDGVPHVIGHVPQVGDDGTHLAKNV